MIGKSKFVDQKTALALVLSALALSCGEKESIDLTGQWYGVDGNENEQTFIFEKNERLTWIVQGTSLQVKYKFDPNAKPAQLDILGFEGPPLEGKTLYGIIEFGEQDSFKFDCDAGPADADGQKFRQSDFTKDTVVYRKQSD